MIAAAEDLVRAGIAIDHDDLAAIVIAVAALLAVFVPKMSRSRTKSTLTTRQQQLNETVDSTVLGKFEDLYEKLADLESELALTNKALGVAQAELKEALVKLNELRKLEEYLQARLHEKDMEIKSLKDERSVNRRDIGSLSASLKRAEARIGHLEDMCREAGLGEKL